MKLSKMSMMVAAVGLLWSCDSGDNGNGGGEIPSEIAAILSENCAACHGDPPADSPMPIVNCNDVLAGTPSDTAGTTVLEAMQARINDASNPMPPGELLAAGPLETLNAWLDDGAPPCE